MFLESAQQMQSIDAWFEKKDIGWVVGCVAGEIWIKANTASTGVDEIQFHLLNQQRSCIRFFWNYTSINVG